MVSILLKVVLSTRLLRTSLHGQVQARWCVDRLCLELDTSDRFVSAGRLPVLRAVRSISLESARVDDLDVDVVPFANGRELGRNAGQAHAQLFGDLLGVDLMIHQERPTLVRNL
jgi:hypothetical protein